MFSSCGTASENTAEFPEPGADARSENVKFTPRGRGVRAEAARAATPTTTTPKTNRGG